MKDLLIREAVIEDVEAIHASLLRLATHVGDVRKIKSSPEDLRRYGFGPERAFEGLIAEVGGEIAGICLFFRSFSTWLGRPGVYVQDIIVDESYRGRHIGERLLRRAAAIGRERGWIYMRLAVDHQNTSAMGFYRRLGFAHRDDDLVYAAYGDAFQELAEGEQRG